MIKNTNIFLFFQWASILTIFLVSCSSVKPLTQGEVLQAMNINEDVFSKMTICQQVRAYTDIGLHFLDRDHGVALLPSWIGNTLSNDRRNDVAQCIAEEGFYRLNLLAGQLASKEEASFALHALIYKAEELKVLDDPQIQSLLNIAICKNDLDYGSDLVLIYYIDKNGVPPTYFAQNDASKKMQIDLCKQ